MAVLPLLSRKVIVNDIQLNGLKATVIKRKDGTLNVADLLSGDEAGIDASGEKTRAAGSEPLRIDVAGVSIANAALGWRDEQSGSTTTISGLDLSTGRVQADGANKAYKVSKPAMAMRGKSESKSRVDSFEVKLVLSGVEGNGNALKIAKLALDLDARVNEAAVKGQLVSALAADLGKLTASLEKIAGGFDINYPQMPMKQLKLPFAGALYADLARQSADGRLTAQFDESKIAFKFGVAKLSPLTLSFDLDVDKFNLDKYLPPKRAVAESAGKQSTGGDTLDFSALEGVNLTGAAHVGQLQAQNVKVANLRMQMRVASGRMDVAPLSASLYEGTLNGAISLDANGNAVALRQNLAGISIAPLLKDAADKDMLEGHGRVALDVTAHGKTIGEMKKALAGAASLSLKDGAIKGINLAQSFRDLKRKFDAKQDPVMQNKATDKTDFTELTASFRIASGVAHNDDLSAKSPFLRLTGNGDIDIGESRLNYLLKATVVGTSGGQGGQDIEYLKGITVPVHLTGAFDNPSWNIEFSSMASEAVKAKVEEAKQKAQEKVEEKVRDRLKALFGK